jgi:hypothetical protein
MDITGHSGIVYMDIVQQFLIPQLNEDNQEGRIHFKQDGAPLITLQQCVSTSTPVSLVGGAIEQRRWHGHIVSPILTPGLFLTGIC